MVDPILRQAKALDDAGSEALRKKEYQKAADDFAKAAELLRQFGDTDSSAAESRSAAHALEKVADVKMKARDFKGGEKALEGAAAEYERAGDNALKMPIPRRDVDPQGWYGDAQRDYESAGVKRELAGANASQNGAREEAKINYIQGQKDYKEAAKNASNAGDKDAAKKDAEKAEELGKLAKLVDSVPHKPK